MAKEKQLKVNEKLGKGSQEHWVKEVSPTVFARGYGNDPAGAFLPRPGKDRIQPHLKINECDH